MSTVMLKGYIVLPKTNRKAILTALNEHIILTRHEQGCLAFEITPDGQDADKYWVYEEFVSKEAFLTHQERVRLSHWGQISTDVERCYEPLVGLG